MCVCMCMCECGRVFAWIHMEILTLLDGWRFMVCGRVGGFADGAMRLIASCIAYEQIMPQVRMSRITSIDESCHTYE